MQKHLSINLEEYNILIWKKETEINKDKLIKYIKNNENKDIINKSNYNLEFDEKKVELKEEGDDKENESINIIEKKEINEEKKEKVINNNISNCKSTNLLHNKNNNNISENNEIIKCKYNNSYSETINDMNRICLFSNNNINNHLSNYNKRTGISLFNSNNIDINENNRYVYISRTGIKYHFKSKCGRMQSSKRVIIFEAKAMGLDACTRC